MFSLSTKPEPAGRAAAERIVEAAREAVAEELVLAAEGRGRELGRRLQVDAARREEAVVSRVVRERGPQARRAAGVEQVGERRR